MSDPKATNETKAPLGQCCDGSLRQQSSSLGRGGKPACGDAVSIDNRPQGRLGGNIASLAALYQD